MKKAAKRPGRTRVFPVYKNTSTDRIVLDRQIYNAAELQALAVLPTRAKEVVAFWDLRSGRADGFEEVIDVGQSINRITSAKDAIPCCMPRGLLWLRRRFRLVEPNESLAFQGVRLRKFVEVADFSPSELQSLAGNAFCGNTVAAVTAAALAVVPL